MPRLRLITVVVLAFLSAGFAGAHLMTREPTTIAVELPVRYGALVEFPPFIDPDPTTTTQPPPPTIPLDLARWEFIHNCEQGDTWYANGTNAADPNGQVFQGGLGMSRGAWQAAVGYAARRGVVLPSSALDATPFEQMEGGQVFYDVHGGSPWTGRCYRP